MRVVVEMDLPIRVRVVALVDADDEVDVRSVEFVGEGGMTLEVPGAFLGASDNEAIAERAVEAAAERKQG